MNNKEQIIIDGIQFNEFGDFYVDYDLSGKFQSISSSAKEYKILKSLIKQLARKTQECESLKEEIEILKDNFDTATRDCNELIEELRQECEELKGKYKNVLDLAKQNADANEYCLQELEQENYRYRKALDEIEEIVNEPCIDTHNDCKCCDFSCEHKDILNIINKVKGDNR